MPDAGDGLGERLHGLIKRANEMTPRDYERLLDTRAAMRRLWCETLDGADGYITLASSGPAIKGLEYTGSRTFLVYGSWLGVPAFSLPLTTAPQAMPAATPRGGAPRSVLIAGAGRSGTSCLAGMFSPETHRHAHDLYAPQISNPKGFFEAAHINDLNEALMVAASVAFEGAEATRERLRGFEPHQLWLARFPDSMPAWWNDDYRRQIAAALPGRPFCLKDPRMAITAPAWLEQAPDALVLSIHRPPEVTAASILKECQVATYLLDFRISARDAFAVWRQTYRRLVRLYRAGAEVRFLRYQDLFDAARLAQLEAQVGAPLRRDFAEGALNRTGNTHLKVAPEFTALHRLLEALADRTFLGDRAGDERLIDAYLQAWPDEASPRAQATRVAV